MQTSQRHRTALTMAITETTTSAEINRHTARNAPSLGTIGILR